MQYPNDGHQFEVGTRIRLTALGMKRCPRLKSFAGVIVGGSHLGRSYRVKIDDRKDAVTLHETYIEQE